MAMATKEQEEADWTKTKRSNNRRRTKTRSKRSGKRDGDDDVGEGKERGRSGESWKERKSRANKGWQSSNTRSRAKSRFKEHLPDSEVKELVKDQRLHTGFLRINPRRRIEAYVTVEGLDVDIIVKGITAQNRAVDGDQIAVSVLPVEEWDSLDNDDDNKGDETTTTSGISRRTQEEEGEDTEDSDDCDVNSNRDVETLTDFVSKKLSLGENEDPKAHKSQKKPSSKATGRGGTAAYPVWTCAEINEQFRELRKRPAGEVLAVVEPSPARGHLICTIGDREKEIENSDHVILRPVDEKFPLLLIDKNTTKSLDPAKFCAELEAAKDKFILVKMTRWSASNSKPYCEVVEVLGEMTDMDQQKSAFLLQQGIQQTHLQDFSEEVMACLPETPWTISDEEVSKRRDLREWRIFSIDPETARDLDDALSVEILDEGLARIGVHIADVTHFVRADTALDEEAASRATSVYMVDGVLPMLPRLLCEELCSLNPGTDRLAFSIIWDISIEGLEIKNQWMGKSIIRSCTKLHYGQAQEIIQGEALTSTPHLHAFTLEEVAQDVKLLDKFAKQLRKLRFESGALTLNIPRVSIVLDDSGKPVGAKQYIQRDSNYLVEEFMLLANRRVAEFISGKIASAAVLRRHPPPHSRKIDSLMKMTDKMNVSIETHTSKAIQESLERLRQEEEESTFYAVVLLTTKPMQNALYFCTGAPDYADKPEKWGHYALAFTHYTHFTSPIRRYADVMVHRLAQDIIEKEGKKAKEGKGKDRLFESTGTKRSPWGRKFTEKIVGQCMQCNRQKLAAKSVQDASIKLYLAIWLNSEPYDTDGVILDLNGPKWMGIFIPEFGMEFKCYWEDDKRLKTKWNTTSKQMDIFDKSVTKEQTKSQKPLLTLENFQTVKVTLFSEFKEKSCQYEISARLAL